MSRQRSKSTQKSKRKSQGNKPKSPKTSPSTPPINSTPQKAITTTNAISPEPLEKAKPSIGKATRAKKYLRRLFKAAWMEKFFFIGGICLAAAWYLQTTTIPNLNDTEKYYIDASNKYNAENHQMIDVEGWNANLYYHLDYYKDTQDTDSEFWMNAFKTNQNLFMVRQRMQSNLLRMRDGIDAEELIYDIEGQNLAKLKETLKPIFGSRISYKEAESRLRAFNDSFGIAIQSVHEKHLETAYGRMWQIRKKRENLQCLVVWLLVSGTLLLNLNKAINYMRKKPEQT